jgi:hypothetical protein
MADNQTTYTAVIDVEVKGKDGVEQLGDAVEEQDGKFVSLRRQIRETTVELQKLADEGKSGTKEFKALSDKLDDLGDQQKKVAFQSGQIEDKLAALPGPIGSIGKSLQGAKDAIDTFGKGIAISLGVVTLIVTAILSFKEALSRTEEGQAKLNKISEAFEKIMNGVFAIIEPIANLFADLVIQLLSSKKAMEVLSNVAGVLSATFTILFGVGKELVGFIINNWVNAFKTLAGVASSTGKILKGVFTFDYDLIKEGVTGVGDTLKTGFTSFVDNAKSAAKGIGTAVVSGVTEGFDKGKDAFVAGQKRLTSKQKEDAKKHAEDMKKFITDAEKIQTEAQLALLDERNAELKKRELKYNEDKKALKKAGISDFTAIDAGYNADVEKINKKFDEQAKKLSEERQKKLKEDAQKGIDERVALLDQESAILEQKDKDAFDKRIALVNEKEKELLSNAYLTEAERTKIKTDAETARNTINKQALDEQILTNDNAQKMQLAKDAEDYDARIALVDEKEKLLLSNVELTEAQRTAIQIQAAEERANIRATELQDKLLGTENELNQVGLDYDKRLQLTNEKEALLLQQAGLTENQKTAIAQQASQERVNIMLAEKQARADIQNAELDLVQGFGSFLKEIAGKNKKLAIAGVVVEQAAAIGKILVNTGIANAKSVAASPLTFGQPWVTINTISAALGIASSVAAGAKAIQQINSADSGTPATASAPKGGSGGGASGGSVPEPKLPTLDKMAAPQITGTAGGNNPSSQLAETIGAASGKPIKAYVVSGDVTSQQALDRRTTRAATFSG